MKQGKYIFAQLTDFLLVWTTFWKRKPARSDDWSGCTSILILSSWIWKECKPDQSGKGE
jgi:hypothetical protein